MRGDHSRLVNRDNLLVRPESLIPGPFRTSRPTFPGSIFPKPCPHVYWLRYFDGLERPDFVGDKVLIIHPGDVLELLEKKVR